MAPRPPQTLSSLSAEALDGQGRPVDFLSQVKPILENKCAACHSGKAVSGGFSLESRERAFASGPGGPRILPGRPGASLILAFASTHKNPAVMPVVGNRLTLAESRLLRRWIAEGAPWPAGAAGHVKPATDLLVPE